MKTAIRFHQSKDQKTINAICNECWLSFYPALVGTKKVLAIIKSRLRKPRKFRKPTSKYFTLVAVQKQKVVGYAACTTRKKTGKILALYVKPSNTNQGIGTKLVKRCLTEFKKRKLVHALVETLFNNKKAIRFYQRFGFKKTGTSQFKTRGTRFRVWKLKKKIG
jgi:ribosomal protein S18 acetylase RimI-like enzyme